MTENEDRDTTGRVPVKRRTRRILMALLAVVAASAVAISLSTAGAAAHHEESRAHHDEVVRVHHEEAKHHHDETAQLHHEGESRDHHGDCDHRGGKLGHRAAVTAAAELLDMEPEALRDRVKGGETLADIATSQGVEVSDVIDAIVGAISDHAAEHGHEIDSEALTEKVTALVNRAHPERPEGKDGWHGRRGPHRWGGHIGSHSAVSTT